jgi:hypothetical protein
MMRISLDLKTRSMRYRILGRIPGGGLQVRPSAIAVAFGTSWRGSAGHRRPRPPATSQSVRSEAQDACALRAGTIKAPFVTPGGVTPPGRLGRAASQRRRLPADSNICSRL